MRVRYVCAKRVKSDRGWVVQASAVSAMLLGVGVVSSAAVNGRLGVVSFLFVPPLVGGL